MGLDGDPCDPRRCSVRCWLRATPLAELGAPSHDYPLRHRTAEHSHWDIDKRLHSREGAGEVGAFCHYSGEPGYHCCYATREKQNVPRRLDFFGGAGRVAHLYRHLANRSLVGEVTRRWL